MFIYFRYFKIPKTMSLLKLSSGNIINIQIFSNVLQALDKSNIYILFKYENYFRVNVKRIPIRREKVDTQDKNMFYI